MAILTIPRKIKPAPGVGLDKSNQLNDSIEGDWAFNEAGGDTAYDGSGNGNHGAFAAGAAKPTWKNGGIYFAGGDYIDTGYYPDPRLPATLSFSMRLDDITPAQDSIIGAHDGTNRYYMGIANDGASGLFFAAGDSFSDGGFASGILQGEYAHFVMVTTGTNVFAYINGQLKGSFAYTASAASTRTFWIGERNDATPAVSINGNIDYVFIINRALAASEIQQLCFNTWQRYEPIQIILPSLGKTYTRSDEPSLPADDTDLETAFSDSDYDDVETDNDVYVVQTAISTGDEFAVFEFKDTHPNSQGIIIVQCIAKSDRAPSVATVTLQIYNRTQTQWETLDSNNVANADTEFTLNGTQATDLDEYYDGDNVVSCRIYQEAA